MPEMARAGEDHRDVARVGGGDDFGVAQRTAGLNRGGRTGLGGGDQAVGKREERVAAYDAAREREARFTGFPHSDAAGIHAAHLARADAERAVAGGVNDGVGFHVFHHAPAEEHRLHFGVSARVA